MSQSSKDRDKSAADSQRTQVRPAEQNGISIGKGVFATVDIDRLGDVLVIDQPLFALLEKEKVDELCSGCFERWEPSAIEEEHFERPKACSRCKVVHYCSKKCQRKDWKAGHSLECATYAELYPRILPLPVRAILRILLCSQAGKISPEIYEEFLDLSYRNEQVELGKAEPAEIAVDISLMATALEHYGKFENYDKDLARRLFSISNSNSFSLTNVSGLRCGIYLHPGPARFNHSCEPNAIYTFDHGRCTIRAIRPIAKGEQIFVPYVDVTYSVGTRRHELLDRYGFICQCPKCLREIAETTDEEEAITKQSEHERSINAKIEEIIKDTGYSLLTVTKLDTMIRSLEKKEKWAVVNSQRQPLAAIRSAMIGPKTTIGWDCPAAVDAAIRHLRTDPAQFPDEFHPVRREHAMEFVLILMKADDVTKEAAAEGIENVFTKYKVVPIFYAWIVLVWIMFPGIRDEEIPEKRGRDMLPLWTSPTASKRVVLYMRIVTAALQETGMLVKDRARHVKEQSERMEAVVEATLKFEKMDRPI